MFGVVILLEGGLFSRGVTLEGERVKMQDSKE